MPSRRLTEFTISAFILAMACGGGPGHAPVVVIPPAIRLSTRALLFVGVSGGANPVVQPVVVSNSGGGALAMPTIDTKYSTLGGWLAVNVTGSTAPYTISLQPTSSLPSGTYLATVHVASAGALGLPSSIQVTYAVCSAGPCVGWPNAASSANGDAWLVQFHDFVAALHPRVLVLLANNADTPVHVQQFASSVVAMFAEGSRYHGYHEISAPAQLNYEIVKLVDMRDAAPTAWPADWPIMGNAANGGTLSFVYEGLFKQTFAAHFGYSDPADSTRFLTLCELFERGIINELWVAAPRYKGNALGVSESVARVMQYDANMNPTGTFNSCAGNGCYDPGVAGSCKASVRLMELATDRGAGCASHATGHGMEGLRRAIPYYASVSARFFGFNLIARYGLPMDSLYDTCNYGSPACWAYPTDHTLAKASAGGASVAPFSFDSWGDGCGNVHFPPNATGQFDYSSPTPVLSTCEDYGGRHGVGGKDARAEYVANLSQVYASTQDDDCGGRWLIYMRQSVPGYGNQATGDDGAPMKNWWPFLFY